MRVDVTEPRSYVGGLLTSVPVWLFVALLWFTGACDNGSPGTTERCGVSLALPLTCADLEAAYAQEADRQGSCTSASTCLVINDPLCADGGYPLALAGDQARLECLADIYYAEAGCPDISCDWMDPIPTAHCEGGRCVWR